MLISSQFHRFCLAVSAHVTALTNAHPSPQEAARAAAVLYNSGVWPGSVRIGMGGWKHLIPELCLNGIEDYEFAVHGDAGENYYIRRG